LILSDPKAPENDALLTASEKDIFILKAISVTFKFQRDTTHKINGFTVKQNGSYTFKKVK
jgi:hypothetical protein